MKTKALTAALLAAASLTGGLLLATPAIAAPGDCDAYSETCPSTTPTARVSGFETGQPNVSPTGDETDGSTLPLTGGELLILLGVGGAAVAGGVAATAAGRRRRHSA